MNELNKNELMLVNGGISTATCTAIVVGGSALAGGAVAGYFSLGTGFGVGATAGGFYGVFFAAYLCSK